MQNKTENLGDKKQEIFKVYEVPDPVRINKVVKFIKKYFGDIKGLNILDCGISKGGVSDILSKDGANCFGIDINPREIEGVKIIQVDLNKEIPEFGIKFNVIFAGEIIEHLFDDRRFIRKCQDFLKPNGLLIITVPNLVSFLNRFAMFFGLIPLTAYVAAEFHYHFYTRRKLKNMIEEEGFEVLKATSSYWPLNIFSKIPMLGKIFSLLGSIFPTMGNQLIVFAKKVK